ncbi:ABC transporter permease [Persicimonas caeni]|uniref:ABC transporter permease n=1 Tax=Persicimonas caeni TaxID=2292766 RepID=A0A4Y6PN93_PERCE|nr:ABC transporter permease [Persicimonas caeni]QDG49689.1 ABC transporter permease [Persicimonas caeni]QED30910.1 ABC transporter permease [Persicimonas caeni]
MLAKLKAGVEAIGNAAIGFVEELGQVVIMLVEAIVWAFRPPYRLRIWFQALETIGVGSLPIVLLTGMFAGLVLAYQSHYAFSLFNAESLVGGTVAVSLVRELGPVLAGLMVAGRTGSSMTTELGTMRVTEQIDAMAVMAVNPIQYLVTPRLFASIIMLPVLTMLSNLVGILAAYFLTVHVLGVDPGIFVAEIRDFVEPADLLKSGIKAAAFGMVIALVGCYKGFYASGGAKGVGEATTSSVVVSSVSILCIDYVLTVLMWD